MTEQKLIQRLAAMAETFNKELSAEAMKLYHAILNDLNFFNPYNKLSPMGNLSIDNIRIRETTY